MTHLTSMIKILFSIQKEIQKIILITQQLILICKLNVNKETKRDVWLWNRKKKQVHFTFLANNLHNFIWLGIVLMIVPRVKRLWSLKEFILIWKKNHILLPRHVKWNKTHLHNFFTVTMSTNQTASYQQGLSFLQAKADNLTFVKSLHIFFQEFMFS